MGIITLYISNNRLGTHLRYIYYIIGYYNNNWSKEPLKNIANKKLII